MRTRFPLTPAAALAAALAATSFGAGAHDVSNSRLPIGDGRVADAPRVGFVMACNSVRRDIGAHARGPWLRDDGTFDLAAKPVVEGSVAWPSQFKVNVIGQTRVVTGNGLPAHATGQFPIARDSAAYRYDRNPNAIAAQEFRLELPRVPAQATQPSCLPVGPIGFLLSGGALFNALDARGNDALAHEIQDRCHGHPEDTGSYHYHSPSPCIDAGHKDQHSPLAGYVLDGFGIFGARGEGGKPLTNADLDECHGHTHEIDWDGARVTLYHYHATAEYPYTIGCFRGTPQRAQGVRVPHAGEKGGLKKGVPKK